MGFELIGFPFGFKKLGGFAGIREVSVLALVGDLLVLLVSALVVAAGFRGGAAN
jgi:hypothetical protein